MTRLPANDTDHFTVRTNRLTLSNEALSGWGGTKTDLSTVTPAQTQHLLGHEALITHCVVAALPSPPGLRGQAGVPRLANALALSRTSAASEGLLGDGSYLTRIYPGP